MVHPHAWVPRWALLAASLLSPCHLSVASSQAMQHAFAKAPWSSPAQDLERWVDLGSLGRRQSTVVCCSSSTSQQKWTKTPKIDFAFAQTNTHVMWVPLRDHPRRDRVCGCLHTFNFFSRVSVWDSQMFLELRRARSALVLLPTQVTPRSIFLSGEVSPHVKPCLREKGLHWRCVHDAPKIQSSLEEKEDSWRWVEGQS